MCAQHSKAFVHFCSQCQVRVAMRTALRWNGVHRICEFLQSIVELNRLHSHHSVTNQCIHTIPQVLACDACIQSPQSPHLRHAHAVTGLLLAAAATSSRIDAALATVLHRTDMVEEAMQFHLTVRAERPGKNRGK